MHDRLFLNFFQKKKSRLENKKKKACTYIFMCLSSAHNILHCFILIVLKFRSIAKVALYSMNLVYYYVREYGTFQIIF